MGAGIAAPRVSLQEQAAPVDVGEPHELQTPRRGSLWKQLSLAVLIPATLVAGWWAYDQRGIIDAWRSPEPAPPAAVKANIFPPSLTQTPLAAESASAPSTTSQNVSVIVTATADAWLKAEADGKPVFARLLHANETKSFASFRQIKILTGNLAGLNVSYNGQPIERPQTAGRVGELVFTSHGWKSLR